MTPKMEIIMAKMAIMEMLAIIEIMKDMMMKMKIKEII